MPATKLQQLELNRKEYINIKWKSSNGVSTRLIDVDDDYLLNIIRSVSKSLTVAEHFPQVKEFQEYNGIKYTDYQKYLQNEYLYREELIEARYQEYLEYEMYKEYLRERSYINNDYGCLYETY